MTKEGLLPMFVSSPPSWKAHKDLKWPTKSKSSDWMVFDTGATASHPSTNRFCLSSSPKSYPKGAMTCKIIAAWPRYESDKSSVEDQASVNILRSPATKTKRTVRRKKETSSASWWDDRLIDANNDVTLALTLQISELQMKEKSVLENLLAVADSNIFVWGGRQPTVLLIYVDSSVKDKTLLETTIKLITQKFGGSTEAHLQNCFAAIIQADEASVSRKALMNMAANAAVTRWIVTGLELERGLILSREASLYAMRQAKVNAEMRGHVFVIPQFASKRDDTRIAKNNMPEKRLMFSSIEAGLLPTIKGKHTMSSNLSGYDCVKCSESSQVEVDTDEPDGMGAGEELTDDLNESSEGDIDDQQNRRRLIDATLYTDKSIEKQIEDLWWDLSVDEVYGTPGGYNSQTDASLDAIAKIHDHIETSLISLMDPKGPHLDYLRHFDKSPILMVDRLGPSQEMMTLDIAPEVEEFEGRCFNLLRLAQLATLDYRIRVLPGAFAASYPKTRIPLCSYTLTKPPTSKCVCEVDSDAVIHELLLDEVKRPAKVTVVKNFDSKEIK